MHIIEITQVILAYKACRYNHLYIIIYILMNMYIHPGHTYIHTYIHTYRWYTDMLHVCFARNVFDTEWYVCCKRHLYGSVRILTASIHTYIHTYDTQMYAEHTPSPFTHTYAQAFAETLTSAREYRTIRAYSVLAKHTYTWHIQSRSYAWFWVKTM